jgi:thiamine-phosphate pyrophosphorylase
MKPRVILITDPAFGDDFTAHCVEAVARELPRGWLCVQLRDKHRPIVSLRLFASRLRLATRAVGASLVINGDARLARDVGADGVHLGGDAGTVAEARAICGRSAWVSVAAHSNAAVQRGADDGADAVLVSPIFPSRPPSLSEAAKAGRGLDAVRAARIVVGQRCAVYALGGVNAGNASACAAAGADGVALIRAMLASAEPARVARAFHDALASRW